MEFFIILYKLYVAFCIVVLYIVYKLIVALVNLNYYYCSDFIFEQPVSKMEQK